jgi:hypothetical protein
MFPKKNIFHLIFLLRGPMAVAMDTFEQSPADLTIFMLNFFKTNFFFEFLFLHPLFFET